MTLIRTVKSLLALVPVLLTACGDSSSSKSPAAVCDPSCAENETCYRGSCLLNRDVPAEPVCYTPCRGGAGCSEEGLLKGCIGDNECVRGTCLPPAESARMRTLAETAPSDGEEAPPLGTCEQESDCPDFQACTQGRCYSDCESDSDCSDSDDFVCSRKVCRERCTADGEECRAGHSCQLDSGETGVCMPLLDPGSGVEAPTGGFVIDDQDISFNTTRVSASFTITNDSEEAERFRIKKLQHREHTVTGSQLVTDDPLGWLGIDVEGGELDAGALAVVIEAGESATVEISRAGDASDVEKWDGRLLVSGEVLGDQEVTLRFTGTREGRWAGTLYYMASNFGEVGLDEWLERDRSSAAAQTLGNAFIRRWVAFRDGRLTRREFEAMLQATETGSWAYESVKDRCPNDVRPDPNTGCYLSDVPGGVSIYSEYLPDAPIPSGVTKFPLAMNVRATEGGDGSSWAGRIISELSLSYPGDPAIDLSFQSDPNGCDGQDEGCVVPLDQMAFDAVIGGRFLTDSRNRTCSGVDGYGLVQTPWLVEGFVRNTGLIDSTRYQFSCRDERLPLGAGDEFAAINANFAGANPIPDGLSRTRKVELIDGGMIDGDAMFVIFRETMPSFFGAGADDLKGYGYMWLERVPQNLVAADYEGSTPPAGNTEAVETAPACASWILDKLEASGGPSTLDATTASEVAVAVVSGVAGSLGTPLEEGLVHSLCVDSGRFDDSACPPGSREMWFTGEGSEVFDDQRIADESCQEDRTCNETFMDWIDQGLIRADLVYQCPLGQLDCDGTRLFYLPASDAPAFPTLDAAIQDAFRYKTQFQNREGTSSVGFAPGVCTSNPSEIPYCYDPVAIEEIADRVDCAVHVYTNLYQDLDDGSREILGDFLTRNFSYSEEGGRTFDGFERLYSELLIMLGDEAYSSAFTARFDLAGQALKTFNGALFEPDGINLTGAAGFEMWRLYQAAQYYQLALDRFYAHSLNIARTFSDLPAGQSFITQATASSYFDRLLRASSQKSRAYAEATKRYQAFRQPALARLVLGRTYGGTYLESVVLSRMLSDLSNTAAAEDKAQIDFQLNQAQLNNQVALLELSNVNETITDEATVFGFSPEYIPFTALDADDDNAFEKFFTDAEESVSVAAAKEELALDDTRRFNVSEAQFQETLTGIQVDYEAQLSEICGTFEAGGSVYPAITKYADLSDTTRALGDPCGFVRNGQLYEAILGLDRFNVGAAVLAQKMDNLKQSIVEANVRAQELCDNSYEVAEWKIRTEAEERAVQEALDAAETAVSEAVEAAASAMKINETLKCIVGTATDCPAATATAVANAAIDAGVASLENAVKPYVKARLADLRKFVDGTIRHEAEQACEAANVELASVVFEIAKQIAELEIQARTTQIDVRLGLGEILQLRNQAKALIANQEQANALAINTAAAFTDPNVRIYKNDAIIAAERTFDAAVRDAYLATKAFEYYTSQSYAPLSSLFLIRMVNYGDFPLDQYLRDLDDAYGDFEMQFGNPQGRVMIVSLRDDILDIPRLDVNGTALTQEARQELFRAELAKSRYRNADGALVFPFRTQVDELSPLTFDHKIDQAEAEVVPAIGDDLARVYVLQKGTGVVRDADDDLVYYSLPERVAVLDAFFGGNRALGSDFYRNDRLHDRPVVNTDWELQVDLVSEEVNTDLDPSRIDDIRLYFYYNDFTP